MNRYNPLSYDNFIPLPGWWFKVAQTNPNNASVASLNIFLKTRSYLKNYQNPNSSGYRSNSKKKPNIKQTKFCK